MPRVQPLRMSGVNYDISERKKAEHERTRLLIEVQHRAAELTATLESIADGLMTYDQDGQLLHMNATVEHMLGYTAEELALSLEERITMLRLTRADGASVPYEAAPISRAMRGKRCGEK